MEIKQLEYFAAAVEYGSLNRAAEKLYTTQPNVSRVLNSLEKELHVTLLERSNKGIKMTPQGEELYGHAMSILKHSNVIRSMSERPNGRRFSVSGYRSGLLTKLMVQLYQGGREQIKYEYREGTVEEITDNVAARISEIGIVYFAEAQMPCFQHIMWHPFCLLLLYILLHFQVRIPRHFYVHFTFALEYKCINNINSTFHTHVFNLIFKIISQIIEPQAVNIFINNF